MASPVDATSPTDRTVASLPEVHAPTDVEVVGYGAMHLTSTPDEEVMRSLTHVELPRLARNIDGHTGAPWRLDLYPDEAIAFGQALIAHAARLLTT